MTPDVPPSAAPAEDVLPCEPARDVAAHPGGVSVALDIGMLGGVQDIASQAIEHATTRIRSVNQILGSGREADGAQQAPAELFERSSPVAKSQMCAGSIDLFFD